MVMVCLCAVGCIDVAERIGGALPQREAGDGSFTPGGAYHAAALFHSLLRHSFTDTHHSSPPLPGFLSPASLHRALRAMARENGDIGRGEAWKKQVNDIKKIFDLKEVLGT
uniref:Uncharacterized protein n=1 Tax=Knipowitschia caucasica TaxID=637954 RepID=A0AAV2IUM1_KNICA